MSKRCRTNRCITIGVRKKISISLSRDLLKRIDQSPVSRSVLIERACRAYIAGLEKTRQETKDIQIINSRADGLNEEAADVLEYQLGEYL